MPSEDSIPRVNENETLIPSDTSIISAQLRKIIDLTLSTSRIGQDSKPRGVVPSIEGGSRKRRALQGLCSSPEPFQLRNCSPFSLSDRSQRSNVWTSSGYEGDWEDAGTVGLRRFSRGHLKRPFARPRAIDLTGSDNGSTSLEPVVVAPRKVSIKVDALTITGLSFEPAGVEIKCGMDLVLNDNSFLRLENIYHDEDKWRLSGRRLLRPSAFDDETWPKIIPETAGELVWAPRIIAHIKPKSVVGVTNIAFTNVRGDWRDKADLTCRIKINHTGRNGGVSPRSPADLKNTNWVIEYLTIKECDPGKGFTNQALREQWRGPTTPFGEGNLLTPTDSDESTSSSEIINLDDILSPSPPVTPNGTSIIDLTSEPERAYTFGDAFCGAGGASCGADQAGLSLKWAFDVNQHAIKTYRLNFSNCTKVLCLDAHRFFKRSLNFLRVDVMHASPPCQPYSPAHTVNNEVNDDRNSACLHGIRNALERVRPRVLTMEETFGLEHPSHRQNLYRVVMDCVELGYSVRWEILKLVEYGVPQSRKRLVLIAAGPGEVLPELPAPTHGDAPSLLPPRTIRDAIWDLPKDAPDHDLEVRLARWRLEYREPLEWDTQAKTFTTAGGQDNYHPDGQRTFTNREGACLQTFPRTFRFSKGGVRTQIGNAFPPIAAKAVFEEVKKTLRKMDALERSRPV
ncbi:C-5 cytosine methyltransferase [Penicillium argentinense]|uniref:DNA (cytosine-5-)-methyltransferase n=1 Tax=Penicillium argentinense TaxID=1131581 RepID=A0A9W9G0P1_9EURO|nr:C-5 cytosine methyltransferase [Penicillium argentinense]KAJ5109976.1 C-5 cytosine methyltransferase [Penicillium argentinense]